MKEIKKSNVPYWGNEQNPFQVNEMDDTISRVNSIDTSIAEINSLPLTWKPKHEWSVIPIDPIMEKSLEIATKEMFRETEKRLDSEIRNLKNERKTDMNKSGVEYANKLKRFLKNKEYNKDVLKLLGVIATRSSRKQKPPAAAAPAIHCIFVFPVFILCLISSASYRNLTAVP